MIVLFCTVYKQIIKICLILFCIGMINISQIWALDITPFKPGEKLTYRIYWGYISAGYAVLQVLPFETIHGQTCYHFSLTAETHVIIDPIYKVRDRIDAYSDIGMNHSLFYRKNVNEGRTHRVIQVVFDWTKKEAQYSNFGKAIPPISIFPKTFDPLSAFYYSRMINFMNTQSFSIPVTDGKKCIIGHARIVKQETIKVPYGKMNTFLLEPNIEHIGGVFEKSKHAKIQIWVTADQRKIPVRLKSKVIVGSFYADLVSIEF